MNRTPAFGANVDSASPSGNVAVNTKVETAAAAAHKLTDRIADTATAQVDRLSGTTHRAVNGAADATISAAEWALAVPDQVQQVQTRLAESACASIRAKPIQVVAGALVVGYLLGRLARL